MSNPMAPIKYIMYCPHKGVPCKSIFHIITINSIVKQSHLQQQNYHALPFQSDWPHKGVSHKSIIRHYHKTIQSSNNYTYNRKIITHFHFNHTQLLLMGMKSTYSLNGQPGYRRSSNDYVHHVIIKQLQGEICYIIHLILLNDRVVVYLKHTINTMVTPPLMSCDKQGNGNLQTAYESNMCTWTMYERYSFTLYLITPNRKYCEF